VHIGRLIAFNFFSEMAYRAPSLLHEYAHFIGHTMFPAALLPIISTLRAMVYTTIGLILMLACQLVFMHSSALDGDTAAVPRVPDGAHLVSFGVGRIRARHLPSDDDDHAAADVPPRRCSIHPRLCRRRCNW
jgi:hypothetical protein